MNLEQYINKAQKLEQENQLDLAIEKYQQGLAEYPDSDFILQNIGNLIARKVFVSQILPFNNMEEALTQPYTFEDILQYYKKAIKINPELEEVKDKIIYYSDLANKYGQNYVSSKNQGIIVAGIPRCGTTLMFRALAGFSAGDTTPKNYYGKIKKTHGLAPTNLPRGYKAIFLFGDIVSSVISTKKSRYETNHFLNCGCSKKFEEVDIYKEDVLNYELMFDSWHQKHNYPVMCLKYEKIYQNINIIKAFLKTDISFPKKKKRTTKYADCSKTELKQIKHTYQSLISKVKKVPNVSIY